LLNRQNLQNAPDKQSGIATMELKLNFCDQSMRQAQ